MCSNKLTGDFVPLVIFSIRKQNCKQKTVFGYSCISHPTQSSVVCAKINKKSMKIKNENFYQFCDNCKTPPCTYYSREAEMKIAITEIITNLRVYMILGDAVSKLDVCMDMNHISRCTAWSLFTLKASHFVKWSISTGSSMWWCQ